MRVCRVLLWSLSGLYLAALGLFLIGTFGLFGQVRDPLAGVFLAPLGLPWTLATGSLGESLKPWAALAAPAVNIAILAGACRLLSRRGI